MAASTLSRRPQASQFVGGRDPWIVRPEVRPDARLRLFCFSYAGGAASVYRPWTHELPHDVELCTIQLPGREGRLLESPYTDMEPLARCLADVIEPYLDRPFAFFGHSMGALVSFEVAREIRRRHGISPRHLLVSGHAAPRVMRRRAPVHQLPDDAFVDAIRELNGTPEQVLQNAELMELVLPALRADLAICETYAYTAEPPLACPISAFGGLADAEVRYDDLRAWQVETLGQFQLRLFEGDHFYLREQQSALIDTISRSLGSAMRTVARA